MNPVVLTILIVLLVFVIIGAPTFGVWNHGAGWYPSGGAGLLLLIVLIVLLLR